MSAFEVALIVAADARGGIGYQNRLPWHLPADLAHFKALTLGAPVVMGRRTFESILASLGKPLPGRRNIVISRQAGYVPPGAEAAASLEAALALAQRGGGGRAAIIGGAQVFNEAMEKRLARRLHLTRVHHAFEADTFFPLPHPAEWRLVAQAPRAADGKNAWPYTFEEYEWVGGPSHSETSGLV